MGLNTYPSNPFPPSTDRMDADTLEAEVNQLKSGLTNVQSDVKLNTQDLTTGSRTKNLLPITVSGIKEENTTGTWDGDTYTESGVSFAIQKDSDGKVTGITANGTASNETYFVFAGNDKLKALAGNNLILNGSIGGATETYLIQAVAYNGVNSTASRDGDSVTFTPTSAFRQVRVLIANGVSVDHVNFYPMIRLATETDDTFVPYIPSVESRIEDLNSNLTSKTKHDSFNVTCDECFEVILQGSHYITDKVVHVNCLVKALSIPTNTDVSIAGLPSGMSMKQVNMIVPIFKGDGRWAKLDTIVYGYVSNNFIATKKSEVVADHYYYIDYIANLN